MYNVSSFFNSDIARCCDQKNIEEYGTSDLEVIELINDYCDKNVEKRAEKLSDEKAEAKFNSIKEDFESTTIKNAVETLLIRNGNSISTLSPFITEHVYIDNQRLSRQDFIRDKIKRDPLYTEQQLVWNAYNGHWQRTFKTKGPEFISEVNVVCAYIVNARTFEECDIVAYINSRDNPLIFKKGNLSTHNIMKALQLEDTSLNKEWVAEAFRRSLINCPNIKFLTIPEHMGGNRLPDGTLTYVSDASIIQWIKEYFSSSIQKHKLVQHERTFDEVIKDYKLTLPQNWKVKSVVVDRVESILLPFYEENGLRTDHVNVISYGNETTKHGLIAILKRVNYESTVITSLSDRSIDVKKDLAAANDIPVLYTYNSTIEGRGVCNSRFDDICHDLYGENGVENPTRKIITILTETPGSVPANLPAYYLTIDEDIEFGDIVKLQQLTGQFDYSLINFLYDNQDAARKIVKSAIEKAHSNVQLIRNSKITHSMIIHLATANILKKVGLISEAEIASIIRWYSNLASSKTTVSDKLRYDIGVAVSNAICSGEIRISAQFEAPYYKNDGRTAFIAEIDGSINVEVDTFEKVFLANIKTTERRNLVLHTLSEKRYLISKNGLKRDLNVKFENGSEATVRVYSLSIAILSDAAKEIVDKTLISDRFHALASSPSNFFPYIFHPQYDIAAGQIINDYNTINPFKCVSGSPGSGKSDFLSMQALQCAMAGDVVIILDSTNSFCEYELREHKIPQEIIEERFIFWDMSIKGFPVDLMDFSGCKNKEQMIERLSSLLISGSHLTGSNQLSILYGAVVKMIEMYLDGIQSIEDLIDSALNTKGKEGEVKRRLETLFSTVAENTETAPGWNNLLENRGKILVISTGNAVVKVDCNPLDIVADHFYSYKDAHRAGNVTLFLDEIQTMNLNVGAPIDILLSKGRKLNIAAFLASQRYSNGRDKLGRIFDYCDTKFFFSPMESCIDAVSAKTHIPVDVLRDFEQGECAFIGPAYSEFKGKNYPVRNALVGKTYRPPYVGSYD